MALPRIDSIKSLGNWIFVGIPALITAFAFVMVISSGAVVSISTVAAHPLEKDDFPQLHQLIDKLIEDQGLAGRKSSLMFFSTRKRRFIYKFRINQPMIAASNAKLATTFAALQILTPNYRWKTSFFLVGEQDGVTGQFRQGLLVKGGGDPTLTAGDMDKIALQLKARGLGEVDDGFYYDDSLFDQEKYPAAWGGAVGKQTWFAPVSPFILDKNAASFFISNSENGIEIIPQSNGEFHLAVSRLKYGSMKGLQVYVKQDWNENGGIFTFFGHIPKAHETYPFSTAVTNPVENFFHHLRYSLKKAGISSEITIKAMPAEGMPKKLIYRHKSRPLRELIADINKESNNLAAEVLVRALVNGNKTSRISSQEGLDILKEAIHREFYDFKDQVFLADGVGLSRDTRLSASFLVHLLNRVRNNNEFRSEYISSLSLAGWDGTLQYRQFPGRMRGRIRAKSGTLKGVQNLSGYLNLQKDVVVFSFLINDETRNYQTLQKAQDKVLAGIFDFLWQEEEKQMIALAKTSPAKNPAKKKTIKPPPRSIKPPLASFKPGK